ncbi:MAG: DUF4175 family protein [Flavobacteriaceae bacterium]|nr:DUF4175 family protein [Flavobacteriaceae bacterium]
MKSFSNIERKLEGFYKKYYTNELIKGTILFVSFGLLYFFFTIYIEFFLWLEPVFRTLLFWVFMLVEGLLFFKLIALPIFHLIKMKKGISNTESSKIIGEYFPEVRDKLLNIIQLKNESKETELLLASIEQKAKELQPIPFVKAVNFRKNVRYAKYLAIPLVVWLFSLVSGTNNELSKSLSRVVNYQTEYLPPAPFYFSLETTDLNVIQGKSFTLGVITTGEVLPEEAKVLYNGQEYYMEERSNGVFFFTFTNVIASIDFSLKANEVNSKTYRLKVVNTPTIHNITMALDYPSYTGRKDEKVENTGNLLVPEGTKIQWEVFTNQTDSVAFVENTKRTPFLKAAADRFSFQKRIRNNTTYQITSSNKNLKDYEKLPYAIKVVKDEYPTIFVQSNIDSLINGDAQFAGQISDDYGISQLELVYYNQEIPEQTQKLSLKITKENIQTFFYQFPDQLPLKEGVDYELFFQVSDNDGVNGKKKAISKKFNYRQKTEDEITEEILQDQRNTINNLEKTIQQQKKQKEDLKQIQEDLQNKKNINWNDKKKVDEFVKRQKQYNEMMQRQTDKLQENIDEKKEESQTLHQKKEELQKRIEELKKLDRQKKLLDELQKMAEKLNKEDLVRKAKELAQQNKQQERSLERILELTKRFYVEQKTTQLANKLEKLSKKQDALDNEKDKALEKQKEINKGFEKIVKELKELQKDNENLKEPMEIPEMEDEKEETSEELDKAKQKLQKQQKNQAKQNQKKASKKMKQMSQKMQQSMANMQSNMIDENIDDLKKILKNLVTFSFQQEDLMNKFDKISVRHPDFGKDLKKQNEIKRYFEHIDDSLYVLSMRTPQLSAKIQEDLSKAHYNLDQSLENFAENRFNSGLSNQQYVMTAANSLSDFLSDLLDNMQNSSMSSSGKGSGKGKSFSLPELIQAQKGLSEQMQKGMQKGKGKEKGEQGKEGKKGKQGKQGKNGQGGDGDEQMNGELFRIYQQQSALRQQLQNAIKEGGKDGKGNAAAKRALKTMEQLENEILEKGFSQGTLQRMQQMQYELLKLDKAAFEQGKDKKRKSNANNTQYKKNKIKDLRFKKRFNNQIEILNRQSLPLRENFEKKVQKYFSKKKD